MIKDDYLFWKTESNKKPTNPPRALISEYAEEKRILPPNTPFPGFWKNSRTPYAVEIMDNMSPYSPVQHTSCMKAAQVGLTAGVAENAIGYWMDESPAEILYISATNELLEKWAVKRLEPLIDSCGFRHKIYAQTENKASRRSGDRTHSKEFVGGTLDMASAQSAAGLRSESKRILIRDEVDGAPAMLRSGEGSWVEVSEARTKAWGVRKKILDISTPTLMESSLIYSLYKDGDQREYFVPCPLCGQYQVLEFGNDRSQHGLKPDFEAGQLTRVIYQCEHCHEAIFNHQKTEMLLKGEWRPTAKSPEYMRSYHISSLYSPVGMYSWMDMYQAYLNAIKKPDGMRAFVNLALGLPYQETRTKPSFDKVIELRGGYSEGIVPEGILYLTAGIDVQAGSDKDERYPSRLEMEILGHGPGYRTASIGYKTFVGAIDDPYSGAWEKLNDFATNGGLTFKSESGRLYNVKLVLIDSGDGNRMDIVYRFTSRWQGTYPSKGFGNIKKKSFELDEAGAGNFKRYRPVRVNDSITLYEISTNYYKSHLYNNLKIERDYTAREQRPGFCDFPINYGENYFRGLTIEEKGTDGSFHCPHGARNEPLDCRVMAQCAGDVYLDAMVMDIKASAKAKGMNPVQVQAINHKYVLELMIKGLI